MLYCTLDPYNLITQNENRFLMIIFPPTKGPLGGFAKFNLARIQYLYSRELL